MSKITGQPLHALPMPDTQPLWDVEEFNVWKGLDPVEPCWHSRGFCCSSWADANDILEYLEHNDRTLILRVARHYTS